MNFCSIYCLRCAIDFCLRCACYQRLFALCYTDVCLCCATEVCLRCATESVCVVQPQSVCIVLPQSVCVVLLQSFCVVLLQSVCVVLLQSVCVVLPQSVCVVGVLAEIARHIVRSCTIPAVRNIINTADQVVKFFEYSPKKQHRLESNVDGTCPKSKLKELSRTTQHAKLWSSGSPVYAELCLHVRLYYVFSYRSQMHGTLAWPKQVIAAKVTRRYDYIEECVIG